jgi:hypothetical protein
MKKLRKTNNNIKDSVLNIDANYGHTLKKSIKNALNSENADFSDNIGEKINVLEN